MLHHKALTARILKLLQKYPECELEELVFSCPELTWHETLQELIRLNRTGQVELQANGRGIYYIKLCSSGEHDPK